MPIYRPSELSTLTQQLGVHAKKSLSQHFLIDGNILKKMLSCAEIKPGDEVLEIGPGPGVLTEALLEKGARVTAIEKDPLFAQALRRLTPSKQLLIIEGDALNFTVPSSIKKVIANLPYKITTPLLERLLPLYGQLSTLTLMVQKEVGERLTAGPGEKDYSHLSIFSHYYSTPTYCFSIKPTSFFPPPKVTSCVVHFSLKPALNDSTAFFAITRKAFHQKRKMLRSSLRAFFDSALIERALKELELLPTARPQDLSFEAFAALSHKLYAFSGYAKK